LIEGGFGTAQQQLMLHGRLPTCPDEIALVAAAETLGARLRQPAGRIADRGRRRKAARQRLAERRHRGFRVGSAGHGRSPPLGLDVTCICPRTHSYQVFFVRLRDGNADIRSRGLTRLSPNAGRDEQLNRDDGTVRAS
jgi:hypothetical protein